MDHKIALDIEFTSQDFRIKQRFTRQILHRIILPVSHRSLIYLFNSAFFNDSYAKSAN